jgi:hypothetical protein
LLLLGALQGSAQVLILFHFFVSSRLSGWEDGVDGQRSEESGVLTDNLAVEGGAGRLDERVAVGELDRDGHGRDDLDGLGGCLVEVMLPAAESWDWESSTSILAAGWIEELRLVVQMDLDPYILYLIIFGWEIFLWLSKEMDGCHFGWEKNLMDVMKFGGITLIDDMRWGKKFRDGFKRNCLKLKFYGRFNQIVHNKFFIDGFEKIVCKIFFLDG